MFDRASEVLKEKSYKKDFQIQFGVYRNYGDGEKILQLSSWETNHEKLYQFIDGVTASGGSSWG